MRGLEGALAALLLGPNAVYALDSLASSVLFTTIRINTGVCTSSTGVNGTSGNGHGSTNGNGNGNGNGNSNGNGNTNGSGNGNGNGNGNSNGNGNGNGNGNTNGNGGTISTESGSYNFAGYYPISELGTPLKSTISNGLTLEVCGNFCDGTQYFSVQDGDECSCTNTDPTGESERTADPSAPSGSGIPCSGNSAEICGYPNFAIVYGREAGGGSSSSSAANSGSVTVVVTGVTSDTAGLSTFTSTEVIAPTVTVTSTNGVASTAATSTAGAPTSNTGNGGASSTSNEGASSNPGASSSAAGESSTTTGSSSMNSGESSTSAGFSSSNEATTEGTSSTSADISSSTDTGASSSNETGASSSTESVTSSSTGNATSSGTASPSSSSTGSATAPCPDSDGQVSSIGGTPYIIQCGTDYLGLPDPNDLPNTDARTFSDCISSCNNYTSDPNVANGDPCIGVTFGIGGTDSCYLKFQVEEVEEGTPGYDSAYKQSYSPPNAFTTSVGGATTATTGETSTAGTSTTGTDTAGTSTTGTDTAGTSTTGTNTAGTNTVTTGSSSTGSSSTGSSNTATAGPSEPTDATTPVCPANNNTIYVDIFGYEYYVKCGLNLIGPNLYAVHADTFPKCLEYCDLINGCAGATYLDGASSSQSNCYPYSSQSGYQSAAAGVYSGVPVNGTSTGYPDAEANYCQDPSNNNTIQTDTLGNNYFIGCDQNLAGSDLDAYVADDLKGCMTYCSLYNGCIAVDFTGYPVGQNQANCYPKSATTNTQYQPGTQYAEYQQ